MTSSRPRRLGTLIVLLAVLTGGWWWWKSRWILPDTQHRASVSDRHVTESQARAFLALEARERELEKTVWGTELEAERHEAVFLRLWEGLNHAPQPLAALAEFGFEQLLLGTTKNVNGLEHGIKQILFTDAANDPSVRRFALAGWRGLLDGWQGEGWSLVGSTWHETGFVPAGSTRSARSLIEASARLTRTNLAERAILRGQLEVEWKTGGSPEQPPAPQTITVRRLEWVGRAGPTLLAEVFSEELPVPPNSFADPMLLSDLDGDGRSEILLVGANKVFHRDGIGFRSRPLAHLPPTRVLAALLADLTGDGAPDLLVGYTEGLLLFENNGHGEFLGPPRGLWRAPQPLKHPQVITVGDIDGDGDLDVWMSQYKLPYQGGQFPTPYFDANDGFPGYLLRNDGQDGFSDITDHSGLAAKRWRRNYSASFVDLDNDGDLDLVTVSDFAGVDLFLNDGHGRFTDATDRLGDARHLFGMAHALADFNNDGWVDLFALGMDSPVASRLNSLGLVRSRLPGLIEHAVAKPTGEASKVEREVELRKAMTYGNRLFLGGPAGLELAGFSPQLAHTGWSWGVAVFDFDNDGSLDVAIANGHETASSVSDYEREFWLHDIYLGSSTNDPVTALYFGAAAGRRRANQISYGGWQNNALFLSSDGTTFTDVAFPVGLDVPEDSQNVASDDLDGDGRLDLVTTSFGPLPDRQPRLRVFRNATPDAGNWFGLRFDAAVHPWAGARVRLETDRGIQNRWLTTGDSYRSQQAPTAHFGLGTSQRVRNVEVFWADGSTSNVSELQLNQWHAVR